MNAEDKELLTRFTPLLVVAAFSVAASIFAIKKTRQDRRNNAELHEAQMAKMEAEHAAMLDRHNAWYAVQPKTIQDFIELGKKESKEELAAKLADPNHVFKL